MTVDARKSCKSCERCSAIEWPCFVVDGLCRMCQARRRDELRALEGKKL